MFVFLPCRKDTSIWGEGTAETICERSDGLRGPLLNAPETDQPENRHRADQLRTLKRGENESVSVQFTESQIVFLKLDVCDCLSYPTLKKKQKKNICDDYVNFLGRKNPPMLFTQIIAALP